jgi:hypothetical protein
MIDQHAVKKPATTDTKQKIMVLFQHHEPTALTREGNEAWGPKEYHYKNHPLHLMVISYK